ncbi:MAG: 2' 3'-cyclic-nucleotide 2'-phosphodiesterase [Ignavibacteria bacterium]|nr:MAG: 2' 3'-cyclic-nucleotide 2'-phosphodiesterase [Ignavibacteria bacterium]
MKRIFSFSLIILLFLSLHLTAQTVKLKVIQSTDEHGAIFPYDFTDQRDINNSLAQVYTYIKQERAKPEQEILLLSGGDIIQGTPAVYYYNFEKTNVSHLYADMMNFMKYDAGAVGNHDIETGHPVYDRFSKEIKFPWLAANAVNKRTGKPYFKPYAVFNKRGVKIAVLGLITPHIPSWLPEKIWSGIEWDDMIKSAQKWIQIIKKKEKPDLIVGLFHSGVDYTYGDQAADEDKNENASKLVAQLVPGFDIIFVGHDHRGWNFKEKNSIGNDVLILGATSSARDVSIANCTFTFDKEKKLWQKEIIGEIVESKNYKPDAEFMEKFKNQFAEVKNYVTRQIGSLTGMLSSRESILGPAAFSDFVNNIQLELTGAQVAFTAPLSMNAKIDKGEVFVGTMFKLYRYENLLYTMQLTGKEIKDYLEYSYKLWFNEMKNGEDHLLSFEYDEKGNIKYDNRNRSPLLKNQYYNFDCAAGINYTVDVSKPVGDRVTISSFSDGSTFDLNKKYKVAVNSYRGNGGGGHLVNGAGIPTDELSRRVITTTEKDLRFYLMKWLEKNKIVTPKTDGNWKVIPEDWWQKGREKDYKILFGN